jgi:hypothetical protein
MTAATPKTRSTDILVRLAVWLSLCNGDQDGGGLVWNVGPGKICQLSRWRPLGFSASRRPEPPDYPVVELSNNLAENAIRPVALGRKELPDMKAIPNGHSAWLEISVASRHFASRSAIDSCTTDPKE